MTMIFSTDDYCEWYNEFLADLARVSRNASKECLTNESDLHCRSIRS